MNQAPTVATRRTGDSSARFVRAMAVARRGAPIALAALIAAAAAALGLAYALRSLGLPTRVLDEPLQLTGGLFVRLGQKPFVDFRSVYPPLNYYAIAGVYHLLGVSVVAYRLYQIAVFVVLVAALTWQTHWLGAGLAKTCLGLLGVVAIAGSTLEATTVPAAAAAVVAVVAYARALEPISARARQVSLAIAGTALFATMAMRLNFGLYVGAAFATDRILWHIVRRQGRVPLVWADLAALFTPFLVGVLWFCVGWRGHLAESIGQMVGTPTLAIARYRVGTPIDPFTLAGLGNALSKGFFLPALPGLWTAARAWSRPTRPKTLPVLLCVLSAVVASMLAFHVAPEKPEQLPAVTAAVVLPLVVLCARFALLERRELVAVLLVGLSQHYFLSRADIPHLFGLMPIIALLVPYAIPRRPTVRGWIPAVVLGLLLAPFLYDCKSNLADGSIAYGRQVWGAAGVFLRLGDARAVETNAHPLVRHLFDDPDEIAAAKGLRARTKPDEPVFIGLANHRDTVINDVRAYWLTERPTGVKDVLLMNGLTTPPIAEQRIKGDLENRQLHWILLWRGVAKGRGWGKLLNDSDGGLDRMIREKFVVAGRFGTFELRQRQ